MELSQFMSHMKNDYQDNFQKLLRDIEDATPNIKNTLFNIYPVAFKVSLKGHKNIYVSIDKEIRSISFSPILKVDFEIITSVNEILKMMITKKIDRNIFIGDQELAMVLANTLQKADIDFLYLLDKYFGNIPAILVHLTSQFASGFGFKDNLNEKNIYSRFRELTIRMDRLEARINL